MAQNLVDEIAAKVTALPYEQQREVLALIEALSRRGQTPTTSLPRHRRLKGSTAGNGPTVTSEEIAQARREMWGEYMGDEQ